MRHQKSCLRLCHYSLSFRAMADGRLSSTAAEEDSIPESSRHRAWTQWSRTMPAEGLNAPIVAESAGGRSSNNDLPFFILEGADSREGVYIGLGWSGDWALSMNRLSDTATLEAGMKRLEMRLKPGEVIRQPSVLIGNYVGNVIAGRQALRRTLRDEIQPRLDGSQVTPPVFWDSWYGDGGSFTENDILNEIPLAAELGYEYLILDGGWTGGGEGAQWQDQWQSLLPHIGTWHPDPKRFSNGFEAVRASAQRHGVKVDLWFDIERAHTKSLGYREFPDLFHPNCVWDNIHILRLERPEAVAWASEQIAKNVMACDARWIRFDFNSDPADTWAAADAPDRIGETEIGHVDGLYRLLDDVRARFPDLMIENCASGGRRIDVELISRTHTEWVSDHTQAESIVIPFNMIAPTAPLIEQVLVNP